MASNAAGRLHEALAKAQRGQQKEIVRDTWARVFDIDASDTGEVLRVLAIMIQQIAAAKERVVGVEGVNHDLYLKPLKQLEGAFSQVNLGEHLQQFLVRLGPSTMETLEFTSEFLRQQYPSGEVPPKTLAVLLKKVEALAAAIREADVDPQLKQILTEHIERLRRALVEYEIRGPDDLLATLDLNLGFVVRAGLGEPDAEVTTLLKTIGKTLQEAYNTTTAALGLAKLAAGPLTEILKLTAGTS